MTDQKVLLVDVGNTNSVFALYEAQKEGYKQIGQWRYATREDRTADEYGAWLLSVFQIQNIDLAAFEGALISSVVPACTPAIKELCQRYLSIEPLTLKPKGEGLGISIDVDYPEQVGEDRLVNVVGALDRYNDVKSPCAFIIIDFGTATTFDYIDDNRCYKGGVIAPGINLSIEALARGTAKLPQISVQVPKTVIGRETTSAMQSGVFWGYVSLIEGLIERMKVEIKEPVKVIATGGLAPLFETTVEAIEVMDSDLTLHGLLKIYEHRSKEDA